MFACRLSERLSWYQNWQKATNISKLCIKNTLTINLRKLAINIRKLASYSECRFLANDNTACHSEGLWLHSWVQTTKSESVWACLLRRLGSPKLNPWIKHWSFFRLWKNQRNFLVCHSLFSGKPSERKASKKSYACLPKEVFKQTPNTQAIKSQVRKDEWPWEFTCKTALMGELQGKLNRSL